MNKKYYIYMLRCEDNSLYTGVTVNIENRMKEHFEKGKACAKYTSSHNAKKLESVWQAENRSIASKLEYFIKQLPKVKKEQLIKENNIEELLGEKLDTNNYIKVNI